jgi:hypothetical protein
MEKQGIILKDKFFELGESPIYNESQDVVGNVAYKLSIANKFEILKNVCTYAKANYFRSSRK